MNFQLKSSLFGISLALFTAIGCIAYEKIVKNCSLSTIAFLAMTFYVPFFMYFFIFNHNDTLQDISKLFNNKSLGLFALIYWLTWITTPLWFWITKNQDVMVGSLYEVKYIVLLGIFYVLIGSRPMSWNVVVGMCLALGSVYFISKK